MIPREKLELLLLINYKKAIYCYKTKDFGLQRLSQYIKDLIVHMIGIENVVQNALSKNRTYDN